MSLRRLTTAVMVMCSDAWLDPEQARPRLEATGVLGAILPMLERAHQALIETRIDKNARAGLDAIIAEQQALDRTHDAAMRGVFQVLGGFAALATDEEKKAAYLELRKVVCPSGLDGTQKSYAETSGTALMLEARLAPAFRDRLAAITGPNGSLLEEVDRWIAAGKRLGELETAKDDARRAPRVSPQRIREARDRWINVVRLMESTLKLANVDAKSVLWIFALVRHVEDKADRKAKRKANAAKSDADAGAGAGAGADAGAHPGAVAGSLVEAAREPAG